MDELDLLDYRREVAAMYARVRDDARPPDARCTAFRREKDRLFATHPASPLSAAQRPGFRGLPYHPFDPSWRTTAVWDGEVDRTVLEVDAGRDGRLRLARVARLTFELTGERHALDAYWLSGYGGGLFVPFRDATSGSESYGGGRYLLDTIKHADLGSQAGTLVLDFNYAYNPSCAYHPDWVCPLAPPGNTLALAVMAGEKDPGGHVPPA
ncbi:MAG: DUF1684 domain-containing protein [Trueperaceae bacterium]|nr:DUF1684 domain-containing protein [Trueperaceae bacterium]